MDTHVQAPLHWSQLSCCWCGRRLHAVVSDVCSNRLCFTICHSFNTRRSAVPSRGEGRGARLGSPFIRSVRWWIALDYRWRSNASSQSSFTLWARSTRCSNCSHPFIVVWERHLEKLRISLKMVDSSQLIPRFWTGAFSVKLSKARGLSISAI